MYIVVYVTLSVCIDRCLWFVVGSMHCCMVIVQRLNLQQPVSNVRTTCIVCDDVIQFSSVCTTVVMLRQHCLYYFWPTCMYPSGRGPAYSEPIR